MLPGNFSPVTIETLKGLMQSMPLQITFSIKDPLTLAELVIEVLLIVSFSGAAAYLSFGFSRILVERAYRNWALWTGVVSVAFIALEIEDVVTFSLYGINPQLLPHQLALVAFAIVAGLWLYSVIQTTLDQDYFHRDVLGWSKLKYAYLASTVISWVLVAIGSPFSVVIFFPIVYIALVLFISGSRTRDSSMRNYLKWLGLIAVALLIEFAFLVFVLEINNKSYSALLIFDSNLVFLIVSSFMVYKAAKSLSPTVRKLESVQKTSTYPKK